MSAMFRPPIAVTKAIGWAEVFGFTDGTDPFWARVRGAQLATVSHFLPFHLVCLAINMLTTSVVMRGGDSDRFLDLWTIALVALAGLWLVGWQQRRRRDPEAGASRLEFWLSSAKVAAFGGFQVLLIVTLLPHATLPQQMFLVMTSFSAMGCSGLAATQLPTCSLALVTMIAAATLAAIDPASPLAGWPVQLCFLTFGVIIARGILVSNFSMMSRMRTEAEIAEQNEVIGMLLSEFEANGSDWLFEIDADWRLTHVSPRFAAVAGCARETMLGQPLPALLGALDDGHEQRDAARCLAQHFAHARPFRDVVVPVTVGDARRWWQLSGTPKHDARGVFTGYRGVGSDITDVRLSHDRIAHLARFDSLTGLANRDLLRERLDDALARAVRTRRVCALLFVDLDRFKAVNDALGHLAGDQLLREVAARLRAAIGAEAQVGRLGGDEFAIVLPDSAAEHAEAVSRAIVAALAKPFIVDDVPVSIGASIGFALGPADGASVDLLFRSADFALYEVKGSGRGDACRFMPAIKDRVDERRALEADLRAALAARQFRLAYQPVVDAADEAIVGFEALLRWHHPVRGLVPPLAFIPVAEETGLIAEIGAWVIREACAQAAAWPAHVRIAVNLSPAQFEDPGLAEIVRTALADNGLAPDRLELEITESLLMNEQAATVAMLAKLKAIGVRFALDDFGTGYSSLGYLRKAAFSRIKIDRSFVSRAIVPEGESAAIIQAIVALATSLGMTTTAEGTETREEFETIRGLGCLQVQGYLFGRPMTPAEANALVAEPLRLAG